MSKVLQQPGEPEEISMKAVAETVRTAILSDIIINKNLKLLHINYLAQKIPPPLPPIFLLGHNIIVTKLMARLGKFFTIPLPLTLAKFRHLYQLQNNMFGICVCT
jgi:hypothetical protein